MRLLLPWLCEWLGMVVVFPPPRANTAALTCSPCLSAACSAGARRSLKTNLCKWCDSTAPACEEKVCYSNCNLNSYCEDPYEICVAIW